MPGPLVRVWFAAKIAGPAALLPHKSHLKSDLPAQTFKFEKPNGYFHEARDQGRASVAPIKRIAQGFLCPIFSDVLATFHNHTKWSDGRSTVPVIYGYADRAGVDILGISDHFCVYPNRSSPDWSLQPSEMADYFAEVLSFRDHGNVEVRVGLEFDWFENHHEVIAPYVSRLPLDYRIGAIHHVEGKQFDVDSSYWSEKSPAERDDVYVKYWGLVRQMAESSLFDIAAHLDLPKKLGFGPSSEVNPAVDSALDAIAAANMVVELNTAGFGKPCADGYPSLEILKQCRARDIPITLSSDGHIPEHILYEFQRGLAQLKDAGFEKIARFRERQRWFEPLTEALTSRRFRMNA